jgi:hypothetical protein
MSATDSDIGKRGHAEAEQPAVDRARRRWGVILSSALAVAVVLGVSLGVGLGVGLKHKHKSEPTVRASGTNGTELPVG